MIHDDSYPIFIFFTRHSRAATLFYLVAAVPLPDKLLTDTSSWVRL